MASISAWSFKKRRRNSRRRDKCNSPAGTGNEKETRNTRSIERARQPKPGDGRLQALEAKVRSFEPQVLKKESRLGENEKENRKLKEQVSKHERKNRARKENIRKYREKNKENGNTACSPVMHPLFFLHSRLRHVLSCFFVVIVLSLPCSVAMAVSIETWKKSWIKLLNT
ncbi:MAG: hypothetical protein ACTSXP_18405, partial [Promethearchaeota archaeon]